MAPWCGCRRGLQAESSGRLQRSTGGLQGFVSFVLGIQGTMGQIWPSSMKAESEDKMLGGVNLGIPLIITHPKDSQGIWSILIYNRSTQIRPSQS